MLRTSGALLTLLLAVDAAAAETVVFSALPSSRVSSTDTSTKREMLTADKQKEYRLVITKRDGKYYWASRENRELYYTLSGVFHIFIDLRGGGYVKIFDRKLLREAGPNFGYLEHNHLWLDTITYWGDGSAFEP